MALNKQNRQKILDIHRAIEEHNLIDSLLPHALPLYINYEWVNDEVARKYRDKLSNAPELIETINRLGKQKETGPIPLDDIKFE